VKTVKEHYDGFLGSVYSWILGDFNAAAERNASFFDGLGLTPGDGATAVDLGAGSGCQSIPLARLGYEVLAVDFCPTLLTELSDHAASLPVKPVCDDIGNFRAHMSAPADLIVCMGDTLVHLPDQASVIRVVDDVCRSLKPGGRFVYAIRDYFSDVPRGADRFVPIRSTEDRIFTCFLDYEDETVHVHDILHQRNGDSWQMEISDYRKLRLATDTVDRQLELGGLILSPPTRHDGMIVGVATRAS
jgi:SAM-dependent methyltransferase